MDAYLPFQCFSLVVASQQAARRDQRLAAAGGAQYGLDMATIRVVAPVRAAIMARALDTLGATGWTR